jgi:hypothetical protein
MKILICDKCMEEEKKMEEARYVKVLITTYDPITKKHKYNFSISVKKSLCAKHLVLLHIHLKQFLENEI